MNMNFRSEQAGRPLDVLVPYAVGPVDAAPEDVTLDLPVTPDTKRYIPSRTIMLTGVTVLSLVAYGFHQEVTKGAKEQAILKDVLRSSQEFINHQDAELTVSSGHGSGGSWVYKVNSEAEAVIEVEYILDDERYKEVATFPKRTQSLRIEADIDESGSTTVTFGSYEEWPQAVDEVYSYSSEEPSPMAHWANDARDNYIIEFRTNQSLDTSSLDRLLDDLAVNDVEFIDSYSMTDVDSSRHFISKDDLADIDITKDFLQPSKNNPYNL